MSEPKPMQVRPMCARCKRKVLAFTEDHDPFQEKVTFTAYCHGEREVVTLTEREVVNITFVSAFNEPAQLPALVSDPANADGGQP